MGILDKAKNLAQKGAEIVDLGKKGIEKGTELGVKGYQGAKESAKKGYEKAKKDETKDQK